MNIDSNESSSDKLLLDLSNKYKILYDYYGNIILLFDEQYYWVSISCTDQLELVLIEDITVLPKTQSDLKKKPMSVNVSTYIK